MALGASFCCPALVYLTQVAWPSALPNVVFEDAFSPLFQVTQLWSPWEFVSCLIAITVAFVLSVRSRLRPAWILTLTQALS